MRTSLLAFAVAAAPLSFADSLQVSHAVYDGTNFQYSFTLRRNGVVVYDPFVVEIDGVADGPTTVRCDFGNVCLFQAEYGDALTVENHDDFTEVTNYAGTFALEADPDTASTELTATPSAVAEPSAAVKAVLAARGDELLAQSERADYAMDALRHQKLGWTLITQSDAQSVGARVTGLPVSLTYTQESSGRNRFDLLSGFSQVHGDWVVTGLASVGLGNRDGADSIWVGVSGEGWLRGRGDSGPFIGLQHHQGAEDAGDWGDVRLSDWQSSALQARAGYRAQWGIGTWWGAGVVELGAGIVSTDWRVAGTVYTGLTEAMNQSARATEGFVQLSYRAQGPRNRVTAALQVEGNRASLGLTLGW